MREIIIKDPSRLFGQLKPGDQDIIGWTPLHYYARCGLVEPCELFLKENQRFVNSQDKYGDTPLSDAAYWGNRGIAALLLENGADVNACNSKGQTPVCRAVMKNYLKMVKLLVKVGKADVNKVLDRHGNTLAHVIAYRSRAADGTVQIMNYLVKHGLDLRRRNKYGDTPFMRACRIYNSYLVPEFYMCNVKFLLTIQVLMRKTAGCHFNCGRMKGKLITLLDMAWSHSAECF
jgi:ankyrin repeat protein